MPLRSGAFFDVGANIGQTLIKVKSLRQDIEYVGFEPNPTCIFYLENLIKKNNFTNCHLFPIGISSKNGIAELQLYSESAIGSNASLVRDFRPKEKVFHRKYAPVFSCEPILEICKISRVSIVKIDVEGGELEVIKGMQQLILDFKPIIVIEILPIYHSSNYARIGRVIEIERILHEFNYSMFRVMKRKYKYFGRLQEIQKIEIHSDLNACDYVCVPHELKTAVIQSCGTHNYQKEIPQDALLNRST